MQKNRYLSQRCGSVLILVLWVLMFLTVFATQIGLRVRQRIMLLSKIESRSQLRFIAEAGVKKGIAALRKDLERNKHQYTSYGKFYRHNNNNIFKNIELGEGVFDVSYYHFREGDVPQRRYGFVDEESKLNINTAEAIDLKRLFFVVLVTDEDQAQDLADAVISWREIGDKELVGFSSDAYYANLDFPYQAKSAAFELIDELRLVEGFSGENFDKIRPFVTVYGDGAVNINTAFREVLLAIGYEWSVIEKIFLVRRGLDGVEATVDDFIFDKTFDVASDISRFVKLEPQEIRQIDQINARGKISTNAYFYHIQSQGRLKSKERISLEASCVYDSIEDRIVYWQEK